VEVGRVIAGTAGHHKMESDVKSLSIHIWTTLDDGKNERVICHDDLDVVGLVDDSSRVSDREMDSAWPLVSYEPGQNNVWPILGWGIIR